MTLGSTIGHPVMAALKDKYKNSLTEEMLNNWDNGEVSWEGCHVGLCFQMHLKRINGILCFAVVLNIMDHDSWAC